VTGGAIEVLNPWPMAVTQKPIPREFGDHDRIGIGIGLTGENSGVYYTRISTDANGHCLQRLDPPKIPEYFTHAQIAEFEKHEGWEYESNYFAPKTVEMKMKAGGGFATAFGGASIRSRP